MMHESTVKIKIAPTIRKACICVEIWEIKYTVPSILEMNYTVTSNLKMKYTGPLSIELNVQYIHHRLVGKCDEIVALL